MEIFRFLYLNIFLILIFTAAVVSATDPYSEALLSLKSELMDDDNSLADWLLPSVGNPSKKIHACSWSGVKCNKNSTVVIALDISFKNLGGAFPGKHFSVFTELVDLNLSYNSFSGRLPVEIFNLTNLRSLDFSRNNFSGQFPSGISSLQNLVVLDAFSNSFSGLLPVEISQLEYIKIVNLAGSYFDGPIPPEYGSFRSLEFIHLAGNLLSGNIPPELGRLKTVTHMEIGYNSYQGSIPWQLGNMSEIQYLDIAGASLTGSIPKELSNLTKLRSLFLFRNHLTGLVPWEFGRIEPLSSLDLSDNQLSGPIPESFSELKNLKLLSLMYNEMNGTVPQGIAQLPSLDTLLIWNNFFSGSLPEDLGRNSKLKWVDVSTNNFVGSIPPDICAGGVLFKLILFSNNFTGSLSPSISKCSSLVRLRIEDNSFWGEIPLKFNNLPDITYVDLSRNKFTGGIPIDIFQAPQLQYFNISNNPELGGTIPTKTWSSPLLQNFSASGCNISGNVPPFHSCKSVSVIELDMNNLEGNVPVSISKCHNLEKMDLASNKFSGHIPEELASLPALSFIDLSHNNFSGHIPAKFGDPSRLKLLNVSFNDISGSIPPKKLFRLIGSSAFSGNSKLCGAPLRPCHASMAILGSKGTRKLTWVLLLSAGVVLFIVASAWGIFYIRRGSKGQWKMVSFNGLPRFTANDVLRSFSFTESMEAAPPLSASVCKAVLPTGITVSVKKIEFEAKRMMMVTEFVMRMGNARHKNLIRLLGLCYNKQLAYLLYDYLPNGNLAEKINVKRDWPAKYKLVTGIARGLCFLHHDCYPAIPHGDLRSSNIVFDENMEPHLAEFGIKFLAEMIKGSSLATISMKETGEILNSRIKEELYMDIYSFGEIILEILTNGRMANAGGSIQSKPKEVLLREIYNENEASSSSESMQEEIKQVLEVALLCTRSRPADRPPMEDALKLLSGFRPQRK
ncbi:leucine-rich repeat receptor-like protein kinase TDR [Ricinus communis]|uniref:Receptor protein kinase CLAVATA1, putative n=1 Tax=Ricinus communis TaxID=3988 RepID=B9SC16_RICCO|nr:leucine-rich repeat receptor-like protein kinase TDR [Ricinus communis]EEF38874.1 Receptor protein kinase CLAVATA1 precursor, putative [Ricinus communis]|eukprot:XP_002523535.1 leucine-rich repeat receptor-like protein kinase TDR [Ricinus communis]